MSAKGENFCAEERELAAGYNNFISRCTGTSIDTPFPLYDYLEKRKPAHGKGSNERGKQVAVEGLRVRIERAGVCRN